MGPINQKIEPKLKMQPKLTLEPLQQALRVQRTLVPFTQDLIKTFHFLKCNRLNADSIALHASLGTFIRPETSQI